MIRIPNSFQLQPFYQQDWIPSPNLRNSFNEICKEVPFYYDLVEDQKYWNSKHDILPVLFKWWAEEEEALTTLFHERNFIPAKPIMITMIAAFIDCLYWMNDRKLLGLNQLKEDLSMLQFKPVNCEERLEFVLLNPGRYHSFTQLRALFLESKKIYAKIKVLEQESQREGS